MKILITGGSACGKSTFAEKLAMGLRNGSGSGDRYNEGKLIYLAAMKPYGPESERRIARHRMLREGKGFETSEAYTDIDEAVRFTGHENATVLIECLPNLLANEMFDSYGKMNPSDAVYEKVMKEIISLSDNVRNTVLVTNDIFCDGTYYPYETEEYIRILGKLNSTLTEMADSAAEIVYSVPVVLKGKI